MVEKTVLPCGLTVISEYLPQFPSLALSYTLKSGSRAESAATNGIHHLIEHMLFKGSQRYDLKRIADISDRLGGSLNAFTSKELTQFYVKAIDEKLEQAFDLLSDLVFHATFPEFEFRKEQNVILQEIKEAEDNPDSRAFEIFFSQVFNNHPLGYPISGDQTSLSRLSRAASFSCYRERYQPRNLVLAAAGNVRHQALLKMTESFFQKFPESKPANLDFQPADQQAITSFQPKESLNQSYLILGFKGIAVASKLRYPFMIMNDILGAGMSSRLFQKIREEQGLAYTISSFGDAYLECGLQIIYGITDPEKSRDYLQSVANEIKHLQDEGVSAEELERAKDHCKSSIILAMENSTSKMRFNVNQELYFQKEETLQEIMSAINRISIPEINQLLQNVFRAGDSSLFIYGKIPSPRTLPPDFRFFC